MCEQKRRKAQRKGYSQSTPRVNPTGGAVITKNDPGGLPIDGRSFHRRTPRRFSTRAGTLKYPRLPPNRLPSRLSTSKQPFLKGYPPRPLPLPFPWRSQNSVSCVTMSAPVTQALSCITQAELFYFTLVNCNIHSSGSSPAEQVDGDDDTGTEDLETLYYVCLGKHSIFILDRWMVGNTKFGGTSEKIPYSSIEKVLSVKTVASHRDYFVICIKPDKRCGNVPNRLICHSSEKNVFLVKLRTCWKADHMFQNWRVGQLPEELFTAFRLFPDSFPDKNRQLPGQNMTASRNKSDRFPEVPKLSGMQTTTFA